MYGSVIFAICALAIVAPMAACSTGAQLEAQRQDQVLAEMKPALETCGRKISDNSAHTPLKSKTAVGSEDPFTLEMLSNSERPSKPEIDLLYMLHADFQKCRQITLDAASRAHPMRLVVFAELYTASDKLWADAVSQKLTWGQFNQGRKTVIAEARAQMAQVDAQLAAGLQNQHAAEVAQRQRAAEAFQQWAYQQQVLQQQQQAVNALNRPRTINCNYVGNTAHCNSF